MTDVTEKRQFKRVALIAAVDAVAGGRTLRFESRNISTGGMLLRGDETLPENETFQMSFRLPGRAHAVTATGIVQHVSPEAFMGVRFVELSEEMRAVIEGFVKEAPAAQP